MPEQYTKEELMDKLCLEVTGMSRADSPTSDEVILNDAVVQLRNWRLSGDNQARKIKALTKQLEAKEEATFTPQDLFTAAAILGQLINNVNPGESVSEFALGVAKKAAEGRNSS